MKIPIWKRITEYIVFTYFNWAVVVPSLIPFMILYVKIDQTQLYDWLYMSIFTSLYIGWVTVKADSKFAPWFYNIMGMKRNICPHCGK